MTVVKPNGWTAILAAPGTYPRPVRRSEAGANPALSRNCDASASGGGRARSPALCRRTQPSEEGRFARHRRRATSLRFNAEVFMFKSRYRRGSGPGGCSSLAAPAAAPHAGRRCRPGSSRSRRPRPRICSRSARASRSSRSTTSPNYPKNAPITKLSGYTPNAEAIAGYKPDLVVVSYDGNHIVEALGKLKIPVLVEPTRLDARPGLRPDRRSSARRPAMRAQAAAVVAEDEGADRGDRRLGAPSEARRSPSTTSSSPISTRRPRRRSSAASTRCSG